MDLYIHETEWAIYERMQTASDCERACLLQILIACAYWYDTTLDAIRGDDSI